MALDSKKQLTLLNQCDKEVDDLYHDYSAAYGLSEIAFWLLYIIWFMGDGCTQSDVCDVWFYKRQSINTALKKLEMQGYLSLQPVPGNRKSKQIVLTEAGKKLSKKVIEPLICAELNALETLDEQERELLVTLSQKRVTAIRQNIKAIMPDSAEKRN